MVVISPEKGICDVAYSMKAVYGVLKYENYIMKVFKGNYVHLFNLLKKEKFFQNVMKLFY